MSNVLDKSFIHRSYPKLAYGSIHTYIEMTFFCLHGDPIPGALAPIADE